MKCYIKYLDSKNKFQETKKDFDNTEDAIAFMVETFDKIDIDFIHYY